MRFLFPTGFDYKLLMSGQADRDPLLLLTPALSPNNVHVVAKLASKIPCAGGTSLTSGMVFCAFALKQFWKKKGKASKEHPEVSWGERRTKDGSVKHILGSLYCCKQYILMVAFSCL